MSIILHKVKQILTKAKPVLIPCGWFVLYAIAQIVALKISVLIALIIAITILYYVLTHPRVKEITFQHKYTKYLIDISLFFAMIFGLLIISLTMNLRGSDSYNQQNVIELVKENRWVFLYIIVIAPIFEETIFRYSIINFKTKKTLIVSTIISIVLFVSLHLSGSTSQIKFAIPYAIPTLGLTTSYIATKDIKCSIILHMAYNALSCLGILAMLT